MTHTSGPWFVLETTTGALSINKTPEVPIATVGGAGWHLGADTARANATLIAGAPDMLMALTCISGKLGDLADCGPEDQDRFSHILADIEARVDEAIAKAEGR